jgi:hypothetical protein
MSFVQNNTLFSYKDLYSVQNSENHGCSVSDIEGRTCNPSASCKEGGSYTTCDDCYKNEYCTNKTYATQLQTHSQKYLGKNQEYNDMSQIYNSEYIKSVNLMVGIIGVLSFIFYNK